MREPVPFTYTTNGDVMICADGPEVLVYSGQDGSPRWKLFTEDVVVGVGQARGEIAAVGAAGTVWFFRALDGRLERTLPLEAEATGIAVADSGAIGVITSEGVHVIPAGGGPHLVSAPGAVAAAFGPGGTSLGIGTGEGVFRAVDPSSGGAWGELDLGAPIGGVAWSARGFWVVTSGKRWVLISGDGQTLAGELPALQAAGGPVAVSLDGLFAAAIDGLNQVHIAELFSNQPAGSLTYRRAVGGLAFGPDAMLGLGLDDGDAMRIDLHTQHNIRTEPHQGRGRNAWNVDVKIDGAVLRGAAASAQVSGASIAEYTGFKPDEPTPWWKIGAGLGGGCLVLFAGTSLLMFLTTWALWMRGLL